MLVVLCTLDVDDCVPDYPCYNDATCVDHVNSYTCDCKPGYIGDHCQTGNIQLFIELSFSFCSLNLTIGCVQYMFSIDI